MECNPIINIIIKNNSSGLVLIEINRGKVTNISEYQFEQKEIHSKIYKISIIVNMDLIFQNQMSTKELINFDLLRVFL